MFPVHADARSLPFAAEFFDAITSIDSFYYYGTDDLYLNCLARFVKPGGLVGMAGAGVVKEFESGVPEHLRGWWTRDMLCLHSAPWWRRRWLDWQRAVAPNNAAEIQALEAHHGRYLGYVRVVGRRRAEVQLEEPVIAMSTEYAKKPLLRNKD